jgi:serine/threonine protein kinase
MGPKLKREVKLLRSMRHPNIVRLYQVMKSAQHIFLVTEFVSGGDVYSLLERKGRIPEAEARHYFQQLISALEYCHSQAIVHRDLKPENLLLDDSSVIKIADFGLATHIEDGLHCMSSCGSPNYAAPEIVSCSAYCGPEVDIWSVGVILFALVSGRLPFDDPSFPTLFKRIRKAEFKLPLEFSDALKDLILRILNPDPIARITIQQLKCHPWYAVSVPLPLQVSPVILRQFLRAHTQQATFEGFDLDALTLCAKLPNLEPVDGLTLLKTLKEEQESQYRISYEILADFKEKRALARLYEINEIARPLFSLPPSRSLKSTKIQDSRVLNSPVNWTYGFRCPSNSLALLTALFNTLQQLGLEWRQVTHNTLRIRSKSLPESVSLPALLGSNIKLDLTVYMVPFKQFEDSYVLDYRLVIGMSCVFLDFCARLHESLRTSLFV